MHMMPNHHLVMRPFYMEWQLCITCKWQIFWLSSPGKKNMSCRIYRCCLGNTIQSTDRLLNRGENVFCHHSNTNICKEAGIFQKFLPSCLFGVSRYKWCSVTPIYCMKWDQMFDHSWRKMFISGLSWNILKHFLLLVEFFIWHSFCFMQIKALKYKIKLVC